METIIEILIDVSGSMGTMKGTDKKNMYLLPDGTTRISLAKKFLAEEILPTLDYAAKINIRTFKNDNSQDEPEVIKAIYQGIYNFNLINESLNSIPDDTLIGGTPITAAVLAAVANLKSSIYNSYERLIILVTDGEENGGGDYKIAAENAMSLNGIKCKIHIIGIALDVDAEKKAKQLSLSTQGTYVPLRAINYNSNEIKQALTPLKISVVQETLQNIKSHIVESNPTIDAKIETLNRKLENINNEKVKILLEDQIKELKKYIDLIKIDSQKLTSDFSVLLDEKQLPLLIKSIERSILNSIDYSISKSNKNFDNLTKELDSMKDIVDKNFENINIEFQNNFNIQASNISSISEDNKKLLVLLNETNRNSKKQILLIYISWGLITSMALFIFYLAFTYGYIRL